MQASQTADRWHAGIMQFMVSFEGQRRFVNLVFGNPMDIRRLAQWRTSAAGREDPHVHDAMEFRKLATKRWRYYRQGNEAAMSLAELKQAIRTNPSTETGFLLVAKAPWYQATPVLGCCFCPEVGAIISSWISWQYIRRCWRVPAGECVGLALALYIHWCD